MVNDNYCTKCDLYKSSCAGTTGQYKLNCIKSIGPKTAKIMIVGLGPGQEECKTKVPFTSKSGSKLMECLKAVGIKKEDVFFTNLIRCRPPRIEKTKGKLEDRNPLIKEIRACHEYLEKEIEEVKPNVIILLGNIVTKFMIGKSGITTIHGASYWSDKYNATCVPCYHPSYLTRTHSNLEDEIAFIEDLKFAKEASITEKFTEKPKLETNYVICDTVQKMDKLLTRLSGLKEFVYDIETTGLNPDIDKFLCISFSWKEGTAAVWPIAKWFSYFTEEKTGKGEPIYAKLDKKGEILKYIQIDKETDLPEKGEFQFIGEMIYSLYDFWTSKQLENFISKLKIIMENPEIKKIGHNLRFDIIFPNVIWSMDVQGAYYDTMLGHYIVDPENPSGRKLEEQAWLHTDMGGYDDGLKKDRERGFKDTDPNKLLKYSGADSDCTYRVYKKQQDAVKPFLNLMQTILVPLSIAIEEMEYNGVMVDVALVDKLTKEYEEKIIKMENKLYELPDVKTFIEDKNSAQSKIIKAKWLGNKNLQKRYPNPQDYIDKNLKKFNFGSTKDLRAFFFDYLKLSAEKKTKTGLASTDEKTLETLRGQHPVIDSLLELRHLTKICSTYLKNIPDLIDENNRLHTNYRLDRTATGRLASSRPNLQNIPKKFGKIIRDYFIASPGNLLIESDLKQIEYRILAHFVNDNQMIQEIEDGLDIHRAIASQIYGIPPEQVTDEQRNKSKAVTFGIPYGRSAKSLSEEYGMAIEEAEQFIRGFLTRYPKVKRWIDAAIDMAHDKQYVKNYFGRIRYLQKMNDPDNYIRGMEERKVVATAVQGTASDILSIYTINIRNRLKEMGSKTKLVLTVHDALFFDTPKDEIKTIIPMIQEEMTRPIPGIRVPIETEIKIGNRWGSLVEYDNEKEL